MNGLDLKFIYFLCNYVVTFTQIVLCLRQKYSYINLNKYPIPSFPHSLNVESSDIYCMPTLEPSALSAFTHIGFAKTRLANNENNYHLPRTENHILIHMNFPMSLTSVSNCDIDSFKMTTSSIPDLGAAKKNGLKLWTSVDLHDNSIKEMWGNA